LNDNLRSWSQKREENGSATPRHPNSFVASLSRSKKKKKKKKKTRFANDLDEEEYQVMQIIDYVAT
jgi:hypothetical protein